MVLALEKVRPDARSGAVRRPLRISAIQQSAAAECGLACAAMLIRAFGTQVELQHLRERYDVSIRGATLRQIMEILHDFGLVTRPLSVGAAKLRDLRTPCILHWGFDHFVVLERCKRNGFVIVDPACGKRQVAEEEVDRLFTGIVLEPIACNEPLLPAATGARLRLIDLLPRFGDVARDLGEIMLVTIALNAVALASPLFLKLVFEKAFPTGRLSILWSLAGAFLILGLLQGTTKLVRGFSLMRLRRKLSDSMSGRVFSDLVWLNNAVIERRAAGTIATNYRSTFTLCDTLSEDLIAAVVDGLCGIILLVILVHYDLVVGLSTLAAILIYSGLVIISARETRSRLKETLFAESREGGFFVETINRLQTLRLFGAERWRAAAFGNLHGDVEDARQRHGELTNLVRAGCEVVAQTGWIIVLALAAARVLGGGMTSGLFAATVVWVGLAFSRARESVTRFTQLESLETHVDRIADIVLSKTDRPASEPGAVRGKAGFESFGAEQMGFRYDDNSRWLFRDCTFQTRPGEWLTIIGRSGEGKSTLVKVLTGLLEPREGSVVLDSERVKPGEFNWVRRSMGVVMQNDGLFGGTIKDNISLFDVTPDMDRVRSCAELAHIGQDIEQMPMQYDSIVGQQGAGLSAGQQQRLMLARALYRQPRLLVLDEFSANLDEATEAAIIRNLRSLGLTIIAIAHRPQMIAAADTVLELAGGILSGSADPAAFAASAREGELQ